MVHESVIPHEAAEWILQILPERQVEYQSPLQRLTERNGLLWLTVIELKKVCDALRRLGFDVKKCSRKADIIASIRNVFYSDFPACNTADRTNMGRLTGNSSSGQPSSSANAAQQPAVAAKYPVTAPVAAARPIAPAPAAAPGAPARPSLPSFGANTNNYASSSFQIPPQFANLPSALNFDSLLYSNQANSTFIRRRDDWPASHQNSDKSSLHSKKQKRFHKNAFAGNNSRSSTNSTNLQAHGHSANPGAYIRTGDVVNPFLAVARSQQPASTSLRSLHLPGSSIARFPTPTGTGINRLNGMNNTYIKQEPGAGDPLSTPQTSDEQKVLGILQNMGFPDPAEILASYRRLVNQKKPHQPDDVMCDILAMRDEVEEAAKMDEARRQSEIFRKEDAKQRRAEIERELRSDIERSDVATWKSDPRMFPKSWILEDTPRIQFILDDVDSKRLLLDLLELEKKSLKWYGNNLPKAYFQLVLDRLASTNQKPFASVRDSLNREIGTLQTAMFELGEQTGGVPKVFRTAFEAAEKLKPVNAAVEIVQRPSKPSPEKSKTSKQTEEIIDLC